MADLKNHPGKFLNDSAAADLERAEAAYGRPFAISDAGRSVAYQQNLIDRWNQGGPQNRPPYLYQPGMPAEASPHVRNGGEAIDVTNPDDRAWIKAHPEFNFIFDIPSDVVHARHVGSGSTQAGSAVSDPTTALEQDFLNKARGESLVVDGVQGPATTAAIKRYQEFLRDNGFGYDGAIDGAWGPGTQAAHAKFYEQWAAPQPAAPSSDRPTLQQGSTGDLVSQLQSFLNRVYPAYSNLVVDGQFGPATKAVVVEFQQRSGITADGIVGPVTWGKLGM